MTECSRIKSKSFPEELVRTICASQRMEGYDLSEEDMKMLEDRVKRKIPDIEYPREKKSD